MHPPADIDKFLINRGFAQISYSRGGTVYATPSNEKAVIIDTAICSLRDYAYVDYTYSQNLLMHRYEQVFRFLADDPEAVESVLEEIRFFLGEDDDPALLKCSGRYRTETDIDPTLPEAIFEDCLIEAFGETSLHAVHREFAYVDCEGRRRFVDYVIFGEKNIAIELNGEIFHHPATTGPRKYRSQLLKQNSLVRDDFKVFRWSTNGMRDRERFIQEIRLYLGNPSAFLPKHVLKCEREGGVGTIRLHEHQLAGLEMLTKHRDAGQKTFLLVLPTATGKTEIFIADIARLKRAKPSLKVLVLVPTINLREQTIERFNERLPEFGEHIGSGLFDDSSQEITVVTYAFILRHYYRLLPELFNYLVVDEAHHAAASGLRKVLEHFNPNHLLGVTATPNRFDQQSLEAIFGEHESILTLEEAITKGQVPPVRCYRIKSNIDLSEVRFNGRDYVKSDLQRTLRVPSRDELVVETLVHYFSGTFEDKQGIVFCVDINHTKRMAKVLREAGIPACAVNGRERKEAEKAIVSYNSRKIRFLCACDLLTEGWDAPRTSILVMARPTFSQVLYTQQLGRGLRKFPGKEALYVIDVVDNYGAKLQPLSLHAFFGVNQYQPFADLIRTEKVGVQNEIVILDGLYEGVRQVVPVNIFNFDKIYENYLNEEQMARELFVSTDTVKAWLKRGEIEAATQYPFGRSLLNFFKPEQVQEIRLSKGLAEHTEETRKQDFFQYLEERRYTFSAKIIFLLSFLRTSNSRGEAQLPELLDCYRAFYQQILEKYGKNDRPNCPYNRKEMLGDEAKMQRSLLKNPFEKFERKRFFYQCKDLNYISLDRLLIEQFNEGDYTKIREQMIQDLKDYYDKLDIQITEEDYLELLPDKAEEPDGPVPVQKKVVFLKLVEEKEKFTTALPFYDLAIAAGALLESETPHEPEGWIDASELSIRRHFDDSMFISKIQGHSMEPIIPDGSYCLFTRRTEGTRNGRIVLAQKLGFHDVETGASFTIKRYESTKSLDPDTEWRHEKIVLKSTNPSYADIEIIPEEGDQFAIIAFFLEKLG